MPHYTQQGDLPRIPDGSRLASYMHNSKNSIIQGQVYGMGSPYASPIHTRNGIPTNPYYAHYNNDMVSTFNNSVSLPNTNGDQPSVYLPHFHSPLVSGIGNGSGSNIRSQQHSSNRDGTPSSSGKPFNQQQPQTEGTDGMYQYIELPHSGKYNGFGPIPATYFISDELKGELIRRQLAINYRLDPTSPIFNEVPQEVDKYRLLVPLDRMKIPGIDRPQQSLTEKTNTYKCFHVRDNQPYCIKRIINYKNYNPKKMQCVVENLKKLVHVNIVQLKEVLLTRAFSDNSLAMIYDYYPNAESLKSRFFSNPNMLIDNYPSKNSRNSPNIRAGGLLQESFLWNIIIQISDALRVVHGLKMGARSINLCKILIFGETRILLSNVSVHDIKNLDQNVNMEEAMREDLFSFGFLLLQLACGRVNISQQQYATALGMVGQNYSMDLKNCIQYLINYKIKNINDLMPMIGARYYMQLGHQQIKIDTLENELMKEMECSRLFRLLTKLNCITERPTCIGLNENWSETGSRYMLKLFRNYVFHQHNNAGQPWMDMAHIIGCLNKLDSGSPERIQLVSSDGKNVLIVTYEELKRCFNQSFDELVKAACEPV
ncbi:PAB-dependent poly(A)-specific ribonuclease subunit PAN3 [Strongyloides ratti]|uniref:PAB-dependent poly(A)-specific ribonuclease subunit PAN3 n=1 Tax=Strongyloides ratti TaxID=34506 RepID=A0A090LJ05_STRRB|nr:PAB-dependent poly(A)-specific ribonuclease subunit PAN3 [Strongyloides ratti]CEF68123.1 PAB-dependent poly(A)-specific ribonuclease subunit PAN3 [Strongyloides ratti]